MFGNKHNLINVCQSNRTSQHYLLHVVTDTVSFYKQNINNIRQISINYCISYLVRHFEL